MSVRAATHYVWRSSPGPAPPYTRGATAATNIQDAVGAAGPGDEIVVTNGTCGRVIVRKAVTVRGANGPDRTLIDDGGVASCLYLANDPDIVVGFTLSDGFVDNGLDGGGLHCESTSAVPTNCVLSGNAAYSGYGGGAYGGTLASSYFYRAGVQ